jgi:hypothetical protein
LTSLLKLLYLCRISYYRSLLGILWLLHLGYSLEGA